MSELEKYNRCFYVKKIISYFIENKLYIIIPVLLYFVLCVITILGFFSTMSGVKYDVICFSNKCLGNFNNDFGNLIKFHVSGAEYIMWMTTIMSLIVAIYSYVVSVKVSMTALANSEFQDFKNIIDNNIRADSDLKNYHLDYYKIFNMIYENSDEGDFSISPNYICRLKMINSLIRSYSSNGKIRLHDDYASSLILILESFGFNVKNRGRKYFHSDELVIIRFLNKINKSILKEGNIVLIERALR